MDTFKLDNPAWYSLNEAHEEFAVNYDGLKFYQPAYCPFGGVFNDKSVALNIADYASFTDYFFLIGDEPKIDQNVKIDGELVCNQMILEKPIDLESNEYIVELQTYEQRVQLSTLVNLVQPGYFKEKTADLGTYYGIYKDKNLIAVAGERMKMNNYTELSAIVTHPDYTGKGYAKQLISHVSNKIFNRSKIPYLHVASDNANAIRLYQKLGFVSRRKLSFWKMSRVLR